VVTDVDHSMRLMHEETFGPVLPVMAFDSDDEAIALANDSEFALAASIWTKNRRHGERLARRIDAGTVMINDVLTCFGISEAPHGGFKSSGIGHTHGRYGLDEMVRISTSTQISPPRFRSRGGIATAPNAPLRSREPSNSSSDALWANAFEAASAPLPACSATAVHDGAPPSRPVVRR
jgi:delta 1-pyrroline-5-carboxylate dehydrogenase